MDQVLCSSFWGSRQYKGSTLAPESNCWLGRWPQGLSLREVSYAHCFSTRRGTSPLSWSLLSISLEFSHGKLRTFFLTLCHSRLRKCKPLLLADWARYWHQRNLDEIRWAVPTCDSVSTWDLEEASSTDDNQRRQTFMEFSHPNGMFISPRNCLSSPGNWEIIYFTYTWSLRTEKMLHPKNEPESRGRAHTSALLTSCTTNGHHRAGQPPPEVTSIHTPFIEALRKAPQKKSQSWVPSAGLSNLLGFMSPKSNTKDKISICKPLLWR